MENKIKSILIELAKEKTTNIQKKIILNCKIDENLQIILEKEVKIDIQNYKHTISNFETRHALSKHSKDQLKLTEKDFGLVPDIIRNYDSIECNTKTKTGLHAITYKKRYNGSTYYIEEVRTGKQELAFKTMYKNKTPSTKSAL